MFKSYGPESVLLIGAMLAFAAPFPVSAASKQVVCSGKQKNTATLPPKLATAARKPLHKKLLSGIASWYGAPFHGRRTASGQIFDMNKLTGAHLTLPLSSRVLVENPKNGKVVVIKVNDRGPYIKNRVIDLSREAAKQLGILSSGIALVNYSVLPSAEQDTTASSTKNDD